jgi:hypothetical protein
MDALLRGRPVEIEEQVALARRLARAGELTDLGLIEVCILAGVADDENEAEERAAVSPERHDPWRHWLVEAWHDAVRAWGKENPGTLIDCTPTWDGRSSWVSQAEWFMRCRSRETQEERTANWCRTLALDWRSWRVLPLEEVVEAILAKGITEDPKVALDLACRAIDDAAERYNV